LLFQGLTFKGLLQKLKIGSPTEEETRLEELFAHLMGTNAAIHALERAQNEGILPLSLYSKKKEPLEQRREDLEESLQTIFSEHPELRDLHIDKLDRDLARTRLAVLDEGLRKGILREETVGRLAKEIQRELVGAEIERNEESSEKK
ncbi:MAG: hypothetical protein WCA08_06625, partial [Desulfoferrobacter sp.]